MDVLHRELLTVLDDLSYDLLLDLVAKKLADAGSNLAKRERATLRDQLKRHNWSDITFRVSPEPKNRVVVIDLADVDLSEIQATLTHV